MAKFGGFTHGPKELCMHPVPWEMQRRPVGNGWILEEKFDGIRLLWIGGELVTREGEPFTGAEHLRPTFDRLQRRAGKPMFFDSEYVAAGGFLNALSDFRSGEGNGVARLFDGFPLEQWRDGESLLDLDGRRRILRAIFDDFRPDNVQTIDQGPVPIETRFLNNIVQGVWARGGEGLVLKNRTSRYSRTRSNEWLKLKRSLKLVCRVLEILNEGAALRVEYQGHKVRVAVPPPQRKHMLPYLVGMDVNVTAMEWTAKGALRQGQLEAYPPPAA